jgi:hypothetical protein
MIKDKTKFTYSKHAKDEWVRDEYGFIKHKPKIFLSAGCKGCIREPSGNYKVTYRYCDKTDIILVASEGGFVITNYRKLNLKNKTDHRGIFYMMPQKKKKLKGKRFF